MACGGHLAAAVHQLGGGARGEYCRRPRLEGEGNFRIEMRVRAECTGTAALPARVAWALASLGGAVPRLNRNVQMDACESQGERHACREV